MEGFKNTTRMKTFGDEAPQAYAKGGSVKPMAKVGKVMGEFGAGKLHSGSKKGPEVTSRKQAIAIGISEAKKAGAKYPVKRNDGNLANMTPAERRASMEETSRAMTPAQTRSLQALKAAKAAAPKQGPLIKPARQMTPAERRMNQMDRPTNNMGAEAYKGGGKVGASKVPFAVKKVMRKAEGGAVNQPVQNSAIPPAPQNSAIPPMPAAGATPAAPPPMPAANTTPAAPPPYQSGGVQVSMPPTFPPLPYQPQTFPDGRLVSPMMPEPTPQSVFGKIDPNGFGATPAAPPPYKSGGVQVSMPPTFPPLPYQPQTFPDGRLVSPMMPEPTPMRPNLPMPEKPVGPGPAAGAAGASAPPAQGKMFTSSYRGPPMDASGRMLSTTPPQISPQMQQMRDAAGKAAIAAQAARNARTVKQAPPNSTTAAAAAAANAAAGIKQTSNDGRIYTIPKIAKGGPIKA